MGRHDGSDHTERVCLDIPAEHSVECSYDQLNYLVSSRRDVNQLYLKGTQTHVNQLLLIRGYVFLNEVFGYLHMPITATGQVCGWVKGPIDFGIDYSPDPDDDPEIGLHIVHEGFILDLLPS